MADTYKVTSQAQIDDIGPTGGLVPSFRVTFESKHSGVTASVLIPLSEYTVEHVNEVITAEVAIIDAVHDL